MIISLNKFSCTLEFNFGNYVGHIINFVLLSFLDVNSELIMIKIILKLSLICDTKLIKITNKKFNTKNILLIKNILFDFSNPVLKNLY